MNRSVFLHPWSFLILASVTVSLSACAPKDEVPIAVEPPPVLVSPVLLRDVTEEIQTTGQLIAKFEATIASQVSGQVTSVLADEGEEVGEGQILLSVGDGDAGEGGLDQGAVEFLALAQLVFDQQALALRIFQCRVALCEGGEARF